MGNVGRVFVDGAALNWKGVLLAVVLAGSTLNWKPDVDVGAPPPWPKLNVDDGTVADEDVVLMVSKLNVGAAATPPPAPLMPNVTDNAAVEAAVTADELLLLVLIETGASVAKTGL